MSIQYFHNEKRRRVRSIGPISVTENKRKGKSSGWRCSAWQRSMGADYRYDKDSDRWSEYTNWNPVETYPNDSRPEKAKSLFVGQIGKKNDEVEITQAEFNDLYAKYEAEALEASAKSN